MVMVRVRVEVRIRIRVQIRVRGRLGVGLRPQMGGFKHLYSYLNRIYTSIVVTRL